MKQLTGRYPRLAYLLFLVFSLAIASGAGRKWS